MLLAVRLEESAMIQAVSGIQELEKTQQYSPLEPLQEQPYPQHDVTVCPPGLEEAVLFQALNVVIF